MPRVLRPWPCGRLKHPFAPRGFSALVPIRSMAVCRGPPGFQAGVVQAVRPPSPRSAFARGSGWAARFLWSGWGAKCRPYRGPTGRSSGRGLCIWLRGKFFPPRRLAWPLGASEERARARRAGRFAGNFGPWLSCSAWLPRLAFREIGPVAGSGFLDRRRACLGCSIRRPIRLRHAVFLAPCFDGLSRARRGSYLAWRKQG